MAVEVRELAESRLTGDEGQIYLLQWLATVEKDLRKATSEDLKTLSSSYEPLLLKAITAPEPFPPPGRPIRNIASRCLVVIYQKGPSRGIYDTMQTLVRFVGDFKIQDADFKKVAAFHCIGELMGSVGSLLTSNTTEVANIATKYLRSSSASVLLRTNALIALRKSAVIGRRAMSDAAMKDVLRYSKSALTDKSLPVQRAAADLLVVLYPAGDGNRSVSDVESIVSSCVKSLDGANQETRQSLARLVGHILASTQTMRTLPTPEPPSKKGKKDQIEDDADIAPPPSAATLDQAKSILSPAEMFSQLSVHFTKTNASRKTRIGIFDFYAALISSLGSSFVEANYAVILRHLVTEIVSHPRSTVSRYEVLLVRKLVGIILRDLVGVRFLSEQGQINAIQEISKSYLKKWPSLMPGQAAPESNVLVIMLKEVTGLVKQLGNSPPPVQEALNDPLVSLLAHPSHSTRVSAAWALRVFCYCTPLRIPRIVLNIMELLQRDMALLSSPSAPPHLAERSIGHAYGLASLFAVIPERPLYVSADLNAKVLDTAIQLLKRAGEHDVEVAGVEVEVAWTCIAALMSLGPNFVRAHLPQLLVLWRNALPKPTSKDTTDCGRSNSEWMFLLHVRECALGAILGFLRHNSPTLLTLDVARRIASLLGNALSFANASVNQQLGQERQIQGGSTNNQPSVTVGPTVSSREALLRRRVYQCFTALGFSSLTETMQSTLLQSTAQLFATPEGYMGSSLQAAIATSSGNFLSLWQTADGYAYGVTTLTILPEIDVNATTDDLQGSRDRLNRDNIEAAIDDLITTPIIGSCEHDPLLLSQTSFSLKDGDLPEPPPSAIAVVDAAIELYSALLPMQDTTTSSRSISELTTSVRSAKLDKNSGRRAAIFVNGTVALSIALRIASQQARQNRDSLGSNQVTSILSTYLMDALTDGDPVLRSAASEAIGRLASLADTNFLTSQMKTLVDVVVNNREPSSRAGCALAFGCIYAHVGGLAAGPLLKTTVNVLMSLGNDPHPVVHYWSLRALAQVAVAGSLQYAPFVSSTLGMLFKLYTLESHEPDGGTVANANIKGGLPIYQVVCQLIDAVISVLGPDIQDSIRTRDLILDLVHEFSLESDEGICVEAIKCIQHLLMFARDQVDVSDLVARLRTHLGSPRRPLKSAAINALYQLVQRDALTVSKLGGDKLVEELFGMLDRDPFIDGVRNVISSWLEQTVIYNPSAWIDLCQRIMSRTTASQQASDGAAKNAPADDEGESLSVGVAQDSASSAHGGLTSRWRTQLFALQCLHDVCTVVSLSGRREHIDIPFARRQGLSESSLLVSRVSDLIKMAFTASAAYVTEIRIEGLVVLRDVIEVFSKSPDADYEDALLLEQYQAPITAALTPAFSSDSTPEILSSAIQVCAVFVGSGIVRDVGKMGRILKLLTSALEQSKDSGMLSLGDSGELSPNASVMLRISTLSAWAELEVASSRQTYLKDVVGPYRPTLVGLWVSSLRDYASIKGDTEAFQDSGGQGMDTPYAGLGREVLLPYYNESWSVILHAVAITMSAGEANILLAMDGLDPSDGQKASKNSTPRDEPTALFFAIFGLVYEVLAISSADSSPSAKVRQNSIIALETLKSLVRPEYSGRALLEPSIFDELSNLCYRMAVTEPPTTLIHLVEAIAIFASSQKTRMISTQRGSTGSILPDCPLTHCFRICAFVLRNAISKRNTWGSASDTMADHVQLVKSAFTSFLAIGEAFGPGLSEETRAVGVSIYAELLKDEKSELDLAGPTLQSLKTLLDSPPKESEKQTLMQYSRLVHGLLSACLVHVDEMRGREGPVVVMKVTNNLLAAVLILTVVPPYAGFSEAALEHCCFLICQKLLESPEVSLRAAQCAKTLILSGTSGNPMLKHCTKLLLPGLIEYFSRVSALVDDATAQSAHTLGVNEICKAFTAFFNSVQEDLRPRVLGVLLPSITLLLDPSKQTPTLMHSAAVTQLLLFATSAPAAFRDATAKMEANMKETLELSVRQAIEARSQTTNASTAKPQISLKSF